MKTGHATCDLKASKLQTRIPYTLHTNALNKAINEITTEKTAPW